MYFLEIHERSKSAPVGIRAVELADDALQLIPALLSEHPDCERIVVLFNATRLFVLDGKGNRVAG